MTTPKGGGFIRFNKQPIILHLGQFTPNMLVLHVSIILGAMIMFFVVKNFPETFTPGNIMGSLLIIAPFLLLKMAAHFLSSPPSGTHQDK